MRTILTVMTGLALGSAGFAGTAEARHGGGSFSIRFSSGPSYAYVGHVAPVIYVPPACPPRVVMYQPVCYSPPVRVVTRPVHRAPPSCYRPSPSRAWGAHGGVHERWGGRPYRSVYPGLPGSSRW
jgi:hypothetical protein